MERTRKCTGRTFKLLTEMPQTRFKTGFQNAVKLIQILPRQLNCLEYFKHQESLKPDISCCSCFYSLVKRDYVLAIIISVCTQHKSKLQGKMFLKIPIKKLRSTIISFITFPQSQTTSKRTYNEHCKCTNTAFVCRFLPPVSVHIGDW